MTQTVCRRSSGPVLRQPSRKNPVSGCGRTGFKPVAQNVQRRVHQVTSCGCQSIQRPWKSARPSAHSAAPPATERSLNAAPSPPSPSIAKCAKGRSGLAFRPAFAGRASIGAGAAGKLLRRRCDRSAGHGLRVAKAAPQASRQRRPDQRRGICPAPPPAPRAAVPCGRADRPDIGHQPEAIAIRISGFRSTPGRWRSPAARRAGGVPAKARQPNIRSIISQRRLKFLHFRKAVMRKVQVQPGAGPVPAHQKATPGLRRQKPCGGDDRRRAGDFIRLWREFEPFEGMA